MADVENQQESSFPVKRKSDLYCQEQDNVANKAQKLNQPSNSESKEGEINGSGVENLNSSIEEKIATESSVLPEKAAGSESEKDENIVSGDLGAGEELEGGDDEVEEDEEEEEEENYSVEAEIESERKGKGISREDKGKGKLIEVEESEDDSDDEDGGDEYDESDLSDDPLAEVDLDNILPSRTRRRSIQPGVYISNETRDRGGNDEDDDSSDDSDA